MPRNMIQGIFLIAAIFVIAGCGVQARSYIQVKERIDQNLAEGNAGYLMGGPSVPQDDDRRKTRRVYVLEFSKENEIPDEDAAAPAAPSTSRYVTDTMPPAPQPPARQRINIPNFEEVESAPSHQNYEPSGPTEATDYTIDKNDTLQKISKKFYGSYGKWTKIYEANKDRIPDPNRIKPGVTITIPAL